MAGRHAWSRIDVSEPQNQMATLILNPDATLETMATLAVGHNISDAATPENTSVTPAKKKKKKKKKKKGGSGSLPFSIVKKEGRGRCVIANHDLPVGFELFCERPFASVSLDASSCSFCFQQLRPGKCVFHCPSCDDDNKQVVQYCCKECVLCELIANTSSLLASFSLSANLMKMQEFAENTPHVVNASCLPCWWLCVIQLC